MGKQELLKKTTEKINQLNDSRLVEVADFVDFILRKQEDEIILKGIQKLAETSNTYDFLNEDPVIYSLEDCKERYH